MGLLVLCSLAVTLVVVAPVPAAADHLPPFGGFEVDGDTDVDDPDNLDWDSPPPNLTSFADVSGKGDDIFTQGSKQNEPGQWVCDTGSAPGKSDLVSGAISVFTHEGDQYLFGHFVRAATNGDVNLDFELNQSAAPNPACPELPRRTAGDVVIAFDTEKGGKIIDVRAFTWNGDHLSGVFEPLDLGARGTAWQGEVNIPNTEPHKINGLKAGAFGELGLNLTDTIGELACGEFGAAHLKSRASSEINSDLKDRTRARPLQLDCPQSELHKAVRNVTDSEPFTGDEEPSSTTADPGDVVEYRLTYHNHGGVAAGNVVVSDEVPDRTTLVSCDPDCGAASGSGPGTELAWSLGTVEGNGERAVTFQVRLDESFPAGETTVANVATVDSDDEEPQDSNETTVTVDAAPAFTVTKTAGTNEATVGDEVTYTITVANTGDADGATDVVDDYDEDHVDVSNISDGGVDDGDAGTITWAAVAVPAGGSRDLTYTATFTGPFTGSGGTGGCEPGQHPVVNTVTVDGDSDSETVCVTAAPAFEVTKSAADDSVQVDGATTYTITVTNVGDATGTTDVVDDYDEGHVTVSNVSGGGSDNGDTITWGDVTLDPGEEATFTYTATFNGPFSEGEGTGGCQQGQFPVVNTVAVEGDSDSETVCVTAEPAFTVAKDATDDTVEVDGSTTYTVTVTNVGDATGTTDVVDDYDEGHVTVSNVTGGGIDDGDTITWSDVTLDPGEEATFTYTATFRGPFSGSHADCGTSAFPVVNTVAVDGDSASQTVCVTALPDLTLAKSADATEVSAGDELTYTLAYANDGDAEATDVVIREDVPEGTEFVSCSDNCTTVSDTQVRWDVGTVPAGEGGSVTLTVEVSATVGCLICNVATIASPDQDGGTPEPSNEVCVDAVPPSRPDLANANGSAFGAHVRETLLNVVDQTLVPVESSRSDVGSDTDNDAVLDESVGTTLQAHVLRTASTSTVDDEPAQAHHLSVAEAAGVDVLSGTVTADFVRGVAEATATGTSSSFSSTGSTFENLQVLGEAVTDVTPNTRIDLPAELFGAGSYVVLYERTGETTTPADGELEGGTYAADLEVNMIRVHVTDLAPLGTEVDVVVSNAVAHADFPQRTLCEPVPIQAVSGHAFIASADTEPPLAPVVVGYVDIPANGGHDHQDLLEASVPADGSTVRTGEATSDSAGSLADDASTASSYAEAADVCLLEDASGCTVSATAVRSQANASADAGGATADDGGTLLAGLQVAGQTLSETPAPNTVVTIPGVGFVVLNEQFCDGQSAPTTPGPVTCTGDDATGLIVRAARLVVTQPAGLPAGAQVVVAEAHADARFTP